MSYLLYIHFYDLLLGASVVASTSCYLLCANQWFVLAKMQTPRCRHGLAVTGEFVYAVGGQYREGKFGILYLQLCRPF